LEAHKFRNFARFTLKNRLSVPSLDAIAIIPSISCNVSSSSVATIVMCRTHIKILIGSYKCNYFRNICE
jgi:hypothetical protein